MYIYRGRLFLLAQELKKPGTLSIKHCSLGATVRCELEAVVFCGGHSATADMVASVSTNIDESIKMTNESLAFLLLAFNHDEIRFVFKRANSSNILLHLCKVTHQENHTQIGNG